LWSPRYDITSSLLDEVQHHVAARHGTINTPDSGASLQRDPASCTHS
jgi:hypothetical protein